MASLLEHPTAQGLLEQTTVSPQALRPTAERLDAFLGRYRPRFARAEQRDHAAVILRGKLSGLDRKTIEPIAAEAGVPRRAVQHFVGAGHWDDDAVRAELHAHVTRAIGDPEAVLIVDGLAVPKKGDDSCGVYRQWCGRLGKVENCQAGVFLGYAARGGQALLDARLYLPRERAADRRHRRATHVPAGVAFQEKWRLALGLIATAGAAVPHGWVAGDDEFGRVSAFRQGLRAARQRYVLDVPSNTLIRDLRAARPAGARVPPWENAAAWADRQPARAWRTLRVRDGEKGPLRVRAVETMVQAKDEDGRAGPRERLVVIRSREARPRTWYVLSNATRGEPLASVVRAHGGRHRVEELFAEGNGDVGLDHWEVRSWVGWQHHVTLSLLALWFLQVEKRRLGKKRRGSRRASSARS
jgi:SRSO17 transposase